MMEKEEWSNREDSQEGGKTENNIDLKEDDRWTYLMGKIW